MKEIQVVINMLVDDSSTNDFCRLKSKILEGSWIEPGLSKYQVYDNIIKYEVWDVMEKP